MKRFHGATCKKMLELDRPLCIIPARGGSKRFPRKNVSLLAGKPLLAYAIEAAVGSDVFDLVCVSSEDEEILNTARQYNAQCVLKRPENLAGDGVQLKEVCTYLLQSFQDQGRFYKEFGLLLVTNPLRIAQDIRDAYEIFKREKANYCMSLVPYAHPPQRAVWVNAGVVLPYFGSKYMKQSQLLEALYRHDGSVIFAKTRAFLEEKEFYGSKVVPYFMPSDRSVDIDAPLDLAWAEFLMARSGFYEPKTE
jgi:CMP-N-acetylneuraminic acid synthetase